MHVLRKYLGTKNAMVDQGLDLRLRAKRAEKDLRWGSFHVVLLSLFAYDIFNKCPYANSMWYYLEYAAAVITAINALACFVNYFLFLFTKVPLRGTKEQKELLHLDDCDRSFIVTPTQPENESKYARYVNISRNSWESFNESLLLISRNWSYNRTTPSRNSSSPQQSPQQMMTRSWNSSIDTSLEAANSSSNTSYVSPYAKYKYDDLITDESSLKQYLHDFSLNETSLNESTELDHEYSSPGSMNSFWNYCNTAGNLLKTTMYQLSPLPTPSTSDKRTTEDAGLKFIDSNSELIKGISFERLSLYVGNLRRWISLTILDRLAREIDNIDESFKNRGFIDMRVGSIGLERLKKTVENQQFVNQFMPKLPLILPFLEMTSNQEYLVQRIKDLAKGSCLADYRWNSGSSYHGLKWDEHLPTDSALIFHLLCVYLDGQLMPLPQGCGRPFYSRYVIMGDEKCSTKSTIAAVQNRARCAILCTNALKPRFNLITDKEIHNCTYDRNNLFYVIIQFLIYMKKHQDSSLEGVNLGRSGINIMCVIES